MTDTLDDQTQALSVSSVSEPIALDGGLVPADVEGSDYSDYGDLGSDTEELEALYRLLAETESESGARRAADADANARLAVTDIEDYEPPRGLRLRKVLGLAEKRSEYTHPALVDSESLREHRQQHLESADAKRNRRENNEYQRDPNHEPSEAGTDGGAGASLADKRPPLDRFRGKPKKALSVTDLVSPAWCELQYFYTLSKHGRKRRTPAMKQGTAVHRALEAEIHVTVPVDITTKEDSWGLRIWNIVQGLKTLHQIGSTRELEVWGVIGDEVVNGVIDELSFTCPDPTYDEHVETRKHKKEVEPDIPEYQTSIMDYLPPADGDGGQNGKVMDDVLKGEKTKGLWDQRIYITDTKTRATPTLPTGSGIRPTVLQLHLYHHMLENMAQGNFHLSRLSMRYDLDVNVPFSDSFLAQVSHLSLDQVDSSNVGLEDHALSSQDSLDILLKHNNLALLWEYMLLQFRHTFLAPYYVVDEPPMSTPQSTSDLPPPPSHPTRLSPLLTAEYLAPSYKHLPSPGGDSKKRSIGRKFFRFNALYLKSYLEDSLQWWRGERQPRGVELSEAWKCRSCDFRDDCEWIHERDKAAFENALQRKKRRMREVAGVKGVGTQTGAEGVTTMTTTTTTTAAATTRASNQRSESELPGEADGRPSKSNI